MKKIIVLSICLSFLACSPCGIGSCPEPQVQQIISQEASILPGRSLDNSNSDQSRGIVNYVWEEPMVDVIDVPPGLDPDGVYYRPAHRSVVEVRQGRWQHYD